MDRDIKPFKRHATPDRLRPHCLVAAGRERLAVDVGLALMLPARQKGPDARLDLTLLFGPIERFPMQYQIISAVAFISR